MDLQLFQMSKKGVALLTLDSSQLDRELGTLPGYLGTLPKNELARIVTPQPCCAIINNNNSTQPGSHWTCFYAMPNQPSFLCFDSMGAPPNEYVVSFLKKINPTRPIMYSSHQIQQMNTDSCGWYCIYMLHQLARGIPFYECLSLFCDSPPTNEAILRHFFTQYHISNTVSRLPYPVMKGKGVKTPPFRKHATAKKRAPRRSLLRRTTSTHSRSSYRSSATSGVPLMPASTPHDPMCRRPLHFTQSPLGLLTTNNLRLPKDHSAGAYYNPLGLITNPVARLTPYIPTAES